MALDCVKCRRGPRTSHMPSSGSRQRESITSSVSTARSHTIGSIRPTTVAPTYSAPMVSP